MKVALASIFVILVLCIFLTYSLIPTPPPPEKKQKKVVPDFPPYESSIGVIRRFVHDYNFVNKDRWTYGTYLTDESSYVKWENEKYHLHIVDDINNEFFSWGFLHQGVQPHGWGFDQPLKEQFLIRKNIETKPDTWFFKIKLMRGNVTWFDVHDSSIPQWLKDRGGKAQIAIGLDFHFETPNVDYLAPIEDSTVLSFEVQFFAVMWNGSHEFPYLDQFFIYSPPYDYDVHNIFVPNGKKSEYINPSTQMVAYRTYEYLVDCGALLEYAWDKWYGSFPVGECRLRYVNFYVEVLNCECDVTVDYIDVYSQSSMTLYLARHNIGCLL